MGDKLPRELVKSCVCGYKTSTSYFSSFIMRHFFLNAVLLSHCSRCNHIRLYIRGKYEDIFRLRYDVLEKSSYLWYRSKNKSRNFRVVWYETIKSKWHLLKIDTFNETSVKLGIDAIEMFYFQMEFHFFWLNLQLQELPKLTRITKGNHVSL